MASVTLKVAPTIVSGTATVYARSNWPATVAPSGSPVGSSTTSASVNSDGTVTFSGLAEDTEYVAYQGTPDRYVRFLVDGEEGTSADPLVVESTPIAGDGRKVTASAGTAVAIASSTACKWVVCEALLSNTQAVAVGTSTVVAASGTSRGALLQPGASVTLPVNNLSSVYVDSRVTGEGVAFIYG